jgi:hypothetical protein
LESNTVVTFLGRVCAREVPRYTIGARLNRNFTVVATYAIGDIQRDLDYAHELSIFATVKF